MKPLLLAFLVAVTVSAQPSRTPAIPITGDITNMAGLPVANASVILFRHSEMERGSQGMDIVGQATTDAQGHFDFGAVNLQTEVSFPLEAAVRYEYKVRFAGRARYLVSVESTAPRKSDMAVASVKVLIKVG